MNIYRYFFIGLILPLLSHADISIKNGGDTTVYSTNRNAFSQPAANMPLMSKVDFSVGNSFFRNPWVIAPASTTARDGLGPLYNTNGCQNCHIKDGRGHPPQFDGDNAVSMLIRLSIPATTDQHTAQLKTNGAIAEPHYGGQLQDFSVPGVEPEGNIAISYQDIEKTFADGETITLRKPKLSINKLAYGPMHPQVMLSARIAPPMIGLGLLQAIDERTLLSFADPDDKNGDGISGRLNKVWDIEKQQTVIGRFGWKAGQPNLKQQSAAAFNGDMGITSSLFPATDCRPAQSQCLKAPDGGKPELSENILDKVTFYTHNLAVPAQRRPNSPDVQQGKALFNASGCASCHISAVTTGASRFPWLANQTIAPYTDLLLHDMGEGLADHRPEFIANGREWRTAPLWGIGLTKTVAGNAYFLHDGRARTLMEAILWHGGEAKPSMETLLAMDKTQRQALIAFLQSL